MSPYETLCKAAMDFAKARNAWRESEREEDRRACKEPQDALLHAAMAYESAVQKGPRCGWCHKPWGECSTGMSLATRSCTPSDLPTTGIFTKPAGPRKRRVLQLSRFDPGSHYYLRFPGGLLPGGDRATDEKYDTVADARSAARDMGYSVSEDVLVVGPTGAERRVPVGDCR